ncbi:hypothetical protein TYRP_010692, partial [Tyrophagus putrescentiae]
FAFQLSVFVNYRSYYYQPLLATVRPSLLISSSSLHYSKQVSLLTATSRDHDTVHFTFSTSTPYRMAML